MECPKIYNDILSDNSKLGVILNYNKNIEKNLDKTIVLSVKNKLRKVIFKLYCGLTKEEKLSIVGQLIGRSNKIHPDDIYQCMIDLHDMNKKITIRRLSELLSVSSRTVHRYMCEQLKKEKELLNQQL